MKKFFTLLEAAEYAATLCKSWSFATADERYDAKELLILAETHDSENLADEDCFYVVSPAGAIGFCDDSGDIDWLFISDAAPNEELPLRYQAEPQINFCPECGAPRRSGRTFLRKVRQSAAK